jgi:hypothetical protein
MSLVCPGCKGTEAEMTSQGMKPPPVVVKMTPLTLDTLKLAHESTKEAQSQLHSMLIDPAFLRRLNTDHEYLALDPKNLQLYFILEALALNSAPAARELIGDLARTPLYRYPGGYQEALLEASVKVTNPAPGLLALWQEQLAPDASALYRTVRVLVANGAKEAIDLFEQRLLENKYREDYVVLWFRNPVLRHRQDRLLLEAYERLLQNPNWPLRLKRFLVEALFDYQPQSWYHLEIDADPPKPPSRDTLSEDSRQILQRIAKISQRQKIIDKKLLKRMFPGM